jgi:hypothetical protein
LAGIAALSIVALAPVAMSALPGRAEAAVEAAVGEGRNALADLEGRSPGARLVGIATKSVKAVARALGASPDDTTEEPEQRALGKVFDAPPTEDMLLDLRAPLGTAFPDGVLPADAVVPGGEFGGGSPGGFGFPRGASSGGFAVLPAGSSGGGSSGGSSGGGSSGGGSSGGGSSGGGSSGGGTPPVAAVPEPGTWMLMILGFGAIGSVMRRRARAGRPAVRN